MGSWSEGGKKKRERRKKSRGSTNDEKMGGVKDLHQYTTSPLFSSPKGSGITRITERVKITTNNIIKIRNRESVVIV